MEFYLNDLRLVKPYMQEMQESDPDRYRRIVDKYNETFKNMQPNDRTGPSIPAFLKDIFCND